MRVPVCVLFLGSLMSSPALAVSVVGNATGTWSISQAPGYISTGNGTSTITYGGGLPSAPNMLSFVGGTFASALNTVFSLGTISYYNGTTNAGTNPDAVNLALALSFASPTLPNVTENYSLNLVSTPNTSDPIASADYVYFPQAYGSQNFTVDGSQYTLKLLGFSQPTGGGFLDSNSSQFHVLEGGTASANLLAEITSPAAVPEAATWMTMLLGFSMCGFALRRRRVPATSRFAA